MDKKVFRLSIIYLVLFSNFLICILPAKAEVQSGEKDGIRWSYDTETKTLTFEGEGKIPARYNYNGVESAKDYPPKMAWEDRRDKVEHIVIKEGITEIGEGVFEWMQSLETVEFCQSIKKIDQLAFGDDYMIKEINLPIQLEEIGSYAFSDCDSLTEITIPDSVKTIEKSAFSDCKGLKVVNDFDKVENIGEFVFLRCYKLKEVKLSPKLKSIPAGLFACCVNLENIEIPQSVTTIYKQAFYGAGIKEITIPTNVTRIGKQGESIDWETGEFESCHQLKTIHIQSKKLAKISKKTWKKLPKKVVIRVPKSKKKAYRKLFQKGGFPKNRRLFVEKGI